MKPIPVAAIFDIGKTNKKFFLFDEDYRIVYHRSAKFNETVDENGFACENLEALKSSLFESLREAFKLEEYDIRAANFSAYGASLVYVDEKGEPLTPLYNYLKPYPEELKAQFYAAYGGEDTFAVKAASPVLGSLNSGMQLYRLKYEQPKVFAKTKYALHLPQYMSFLLAGKACSDITSIGCHTNFWDFGEHDYNEWVHKEHIAEKLAPIVKADEIVSIDIEGKSIKVGSGLHDSSAALIPYLANFREPFMLLSTGTWCISLNPFNHAPLTQDELNNDCLCYLDYRGNPVKASRLFAGHDHDMKAKRLADHFRQHVGKYKDVEYNPHIMPTLISNNALVKNNEMLPFNEVDLSTFKSDEEAYHYLICELVQQQVRSSALVLKDTPVRRIFVDGGFSKNTVYMNLLASAFNDMEIYAASMPQATSLGAAIALHRHWNTKELPANLIELNYYAGNSILAPKSFY